MKFGLNLALRRFQKEQRIWNLKRIQELPRRLFRPEKGAGKTALECSFPNVYRGEKSQILPRFSALVLFESSAFRNGAIYLTSKTNSGRRRWFSYAISEFGVLQSPRLWENGVKISHHEKRARRMCWIIDNSMTHCPILLKVLRLVHNGHARLWSC